MMRIIILIIAVLNITSVAFGQKRTIEKRETGSFPEKGDYVTDSGIDKFIGIWEWKSKNETFRVVLEKEEKFYFQKLDIYMDLLVVRHLYQKNGQTIEDNLSVPFLKASNGGSLDDQSVNINFKDISKSKNGRAKLKLLEGRTDEAIWTLTPKETIIVDRKSPAPGPGFSVPTDVILKKIK